MSKIKLTDEVLYEILNNNDDDIVMNHYYNAAVDGNVAAESSDSLLKLLFILIRFYDNKLFCEIKNDPLDFFGMEKHNENSEQAKLLELLDRTYFEILKCEEKGIPLPPQKVLAEFYERYAHALYCFGHYFKCLEFCDKAKHNGEENPLALFLKASVIELCYINKTDDIYKIALYNYQKKLIDKCDLAKTWIDIRICQEVSDIINMRVESFDPISKAISFIPVKEDFQATKKEAKDWTEEKDFYLRNNLFLNPLNVFEVYVSAATEEFEQVDISDRNKKYFDAVLDDYKTCRTKLYEHMTEKKILNNSELAMTYNYIYTIFDKLSFLISKVYKLNGNEGTIEFSPDGLFNRQISGKSMLFKEIKNDNIWPLYLIMKDVRKMSNLKKLQANTFNLKKMRNCVEHRSVILVGMADLEKAALLLLKLARDAILYTFALIHTCSKDFAIDKATTIGTTFHWAAKRIVDRGTETDLIIK